MKRLSNIEKAVLMYIINRAKETISLYEFDRMIVYVFKRNNHPGEYLMPLLNREYLIQMNKSKDEMALYKVTDKGRASIKSEYESIKEILTAIDGKLSTIQEIQKKEQIAPFYIFHVDDRPFRLMVGIDEIMINMPTRKEFEEEQVNIAVKEFNANPSVLFDLIMSQISLIFRKS